MGTPRTFVRAILMVFKLILETTSSVIIELRSYFEILADGVTLREAQT